ncbi:MAG: chorismate mutase [Clostridiales bacterium]|jgi:monofunctional chorismate mutase|nr:chorismate mutase [Clostridiales bacterium]
MFITKAVRGAITVDNNDRDEILNAAEELLGEIFKRNKSIKPGNIVSIIFTATKDLTKAYPAEAARRMGLTEAALMCFQEMYVEGSLEKCIRVLVQYWDLQYPKPEFVYLKGAVNLRPDLKK